MPATTATTSGPSPPSTAAITPDTRLVSISHVLWTTGAVLPVAAIAEIAHARGALVVVDGAQAAGAIPFRFDDLGADLYAVPGAEVAARAGGDGRAGRRARGRSSGSRPAIAGWFSFERVDGQGTAEWWPDARRFECVELPPAVGRRDGPLDRLAVDVRRTRLRATGAGWRTARRGRGPAGRDPGRDAS